MSDRSTIKNELQWFVPKNSVQRPSYGHNSISAMRFTDSMEKTSFQIHSGDKNMSNSSSKGTAMTLHSTADLKLVDGDIGIEETAKHVVRTAIQNFGVS